MRNAELQALCRQWQTVLRLQDWNVTARFARAREIDDGEPDEGNLACVWQRPDHQEALILVLDPTDYNPKGVVPPDSEMSLVHELLHLHFSDFMPERGLKHQRAELAINLLSGALVELKRRGKPKK